MLHINLLEMKAVWLGLQSFQKIFTGHRVTVMCDNSTVVAYVSKQGGTHSRSMCELTSRLLKWTENIDVHLEARYLPVQNNVLADLLSRRDQAIATEWTLHRQVAKALLSAVGLTVDRPVRVETQRSATGLLLPSPGRPGGSRGCVSASLGQPGRVRVSALCSARKGTVTSTAVSKLFDDSGSSSLGRQGLVRGSTAPADASTSRSASVGRRHSPAPQRSTPPRRPRVETSCVATVK